MVRLDHIIEIPYRGGLPVFDYLLVRLLDLLVLFVLLFFLIFFL